MYKLRDENDVTNSFFIEFEHIHLSELKSTIIDRHIFGVFVVNSEHIQHIPFQ